jgi:hypothetical protein
MPSSGAKSDLRFSTTSQLLDNLLIRKHILQQNGHNNWKLLNRYLWYFLDI